MVPDKIYREQQKAMLEASLDQRTAAAVAFFERVPIVIPALQDDVLRTVAGLAHLGLGYALRSMAERCEDDDL